MLAHKSRGCSRTAYPAGGGLLKEWKAAAGREEANLFPQLIECVKACSTVQEICDTLREVFGEYRPAAI